MDFDFDDFLGIYITLGAACGEGKVCPNASSSDCKQTPGYSGHSAKWTTQVQLSMGGTPTKS